MKVLVTGHNGYIGSILTPMLQSKGHDVLGLDAYYFEDCTLGNERSKIPFIRKDLRDLTEEDVHGVDAVIHLAALSNDPLGDLDAKLTYDINFHASAHLARLAKAAGASRFLFSSSCSMYGAAADDLLTEVSPFNPVTPYAVSKVQTEEELDKLADEDFSPVYLRNATAYGFSPRFRADIVLNNLVGWAFTTGEVRIMSDGTPWRPLIHVEDIARAFVAILEAPREKIHNQAFNVGVNGENYQIRDLADLVEEIVPGCHIQYAGQGGPDPRNYRVDFSKLATHVKSFVPKWNARLGTKELFEVYRRAGLTLDDFQGRKFTRLTQIKHLMSSGYLDSALRWK